MVLQCSGDEEEQTRRQEISDAQGKLAEGSVLEILLSCPFLVLWRREQAVVGAFWSVLIGLPSAGFLSCTSAICEAEDSSGSLFPEVSGPSSSSEVRSLSAFSTFQSPVCFIYNIQDS